MPRKPFPCAVCGEPLHPGSNTLPEGVAAHARCGGARKASAVPRVPRVGPVAVAPKVPADIEGFEGFVDDDMSSRREELDWMRLMLRESIRAAEAEKRAPLLRELRAVVDELARLGVGREAEEVRADGVVDFRAVLAARLADAAASGDAAAGSDAR